MILRSASFIQRFSKIIMNESRENHWLATVPVYFISCINDINSMVHTATIFTLTRDSDKSER